MASNKIVAEVSDFMAGSDARASSSGGRKGCDARKDSLRACTPGVPLPPHPALSPGGGEGGRRPGEGGSMREGLVRGVRGELFQSPHQCRKNLLPSPARFWLNMPLREGRVSRVAVR